LPVQVREIVFYSLDATSHHLLVDPTTLRPSEVRILRASSSFWHCAAMREADKVQASSAGILL
jgi:hypothetical protein